MQSVAENFMLCQLETHARVGNSTANNLSTNSDIASYEEEDCEGVGAANIDERSTGCCKEHWVPSERGSTALEQQVQVSRPNQIEDIELRALDRRGVDLEQKASECLDCLPAGSRVAVVVMQGSLCPVTHGHVASFLEARKIFMALDGVARPARLELFHECLGLFRLNNDGHVRIKMQQKKQPFLNRDERRHLVRLATEEYNWLGHTSQSSLHLMRELKGRYPNVSFTQFQLNGADDVGRYHKWLGASRGHRLITMGRPGETEKVLKGVKKAKIDLDDGIFIMGPELPDISSTKLRSQLMKGEKDPHRLSDLVNLKVAAWCIHRWTKEGWSRARSQK